MAMQEKPLRESTKNFLETYGKYYPASRVFNHFITPYPKEVFSVNRESHFNQERNGNLIDQQRCVVRLVIGKGVYIPVKPFVYIGSGKDPQWLIPVAEESRKQGNIPLLFDSVDRAIRHPFYHSNHYPNLQPGRRELEALLEVTKGIPLYTIIHPDATPEEIRSHQRKRGIREKGNATNPGRKDCKGIKERNYATVLLMRDMGYSLGRIADYLCLSKATVQRWVEDSK